MVEATHYLWGGLGFKTLLRVTKFWYTMKTSGGWKWFTYHMLSFMFLETHSYNCQCSIIHIRWKFIWFHRSNLASSSMIKHLFYSPLSLLQNTMSQNDANLQWKSIALEKVVSSCKNKCFSAEINVFRQK